MKIQKASLLIKILEYKDVFFTLLDYVNDNDNSNDVPEIIYLQLYNKYIAKNDDTEASQWLTLESLTENDIFVHNDKNAGTITLQAFLIETLRFIDIERAKELSSTDFEKIREQFQSIWESVNSCSGIGSDHYHELMANFNELLTTTLSKVKRNVEVLAVQADDIASKFDLRHDHTTSYNANDLYQKLSSLFEKYVYPSLEFTNPKMEMSGFGKLTFVQVIDEFIQYHSKAPKVASQIGYKKTAVTSFYKDIKRVLEKLERYYRFVEIDRANYLSIEKAFNHLGQEVDRLRHGKSRNKYLTNDLEVLNQYHTFKNLAFHKSKFSKKLAWKAPLSTIHFKQWFEDLKDTEIVEDVEHDSVFNAPSISLQREKEIIEWCMAHNWERNVDDIHQYIQIELKKAFASQYQLTDLLAGLESFFAIVDRKLYKRSPKKVKIIEGKYYMDYLIISLTAEEPSHV
ncbi:hypothetical protein FGD67_21295 [Colwellia sp. M166]|uniref:hypothetical protein n=1 Tax=Colwellia sp. M166 TaxID=2583805 RepID=UPI00211E7105|nr:hypothetical protein [Colwellia sp. M166]UUO25468.1 hypothetical protein FGD67_21295 [Colwellia sp. M166]